MSPPFVGHCKIMGCSRLERMALQHSDMCRARFMSERAVFLWIDETGCDRLCQARNAHTFRRIPDAEYFGAIHGSLGADRQTDTHDNYRNPRCACAPRVNNNYVRYQFQCLYHQAVG